MAEAAQVAALTAYFDEEAHRVNGMNRHQLWQSWKAYARKHHPDFEGALSQEVRTTVGPEGLPSCSMGLIVVGRAWRDFLAAVLSPMRNLWQSLPTETG